MNKDGTNQIVLNLADYSIMKKITPISKSDKKNYLYKDPLTHKLVILSLNSVNQY